GRTGRQCGPAKTFPRAGHSRERHRQSANPQYGHGRRRSLPTTALLVFPQWLWAVRQRRRHPARAGRRQSLSRHLWQRRAGFVRGHVAPVPWPAPQAAKVLDGAKLDANLAARCGETASEGAKPLSGNGYKVQLVKTAVKRALLAAAGV